MLTQEKSTFAGTLLTDRLCWSSVVFAGIPKEPPPLALETASTTQPTSLLVTFLQYSSIVIQDTKGQTLLFDSLEKCQSVIISVRPAECLCVAKTFTLQFSLTVNIINIKLCMMIVLIQLYPFIKLSVTLIAFQRHSSVKPFSLKFDVII